MKRVPNPVEPAAAADDYERCIMCGNPTNIHKSTPIELRKDYIVGCGQLCVSCCNQLRNNIPQEEWE